MADHFLADAVDSVRRTLALTAEPSDDARLLARFVRDRDEAAFAELVARHGPAVWTACRRGAPTAADAEDAFQATFLVLVQRADRVRRSASVGGWLFRIAVRLSARTRDRATIPLDPDRPVFDPAPDPAQLAAQRDLVSALETELAGLPETLRAALVACYYEGLTQDAAARQLGWKVRTVRARVTRGREQLRRRLARRGIDLGAAMAAAAAVGTDASANLPRVSLPLTFGGTVSPSVSQLVNHGVELTARAVSLRLAVGIAAIVVAAAGVGYALVEGLGTNPAEGTSGQHLANAHSGLPQPPHEPPFDAAAVYDRVVDGYVYIVRETKGMPVEGSGTLIDKENRLVLTTYRVVGESDVVSVQFPFHNLDGNIETDRQDYARAAAAKYLSPRGRVIRRDKTRHLALVQLDRLERHARAIELADTNSQKAVLHIGAHMGGLFSMTMRKVLPVDASAVADAATAMTVPDRFPPIAMSGTPADSGGPLLDRDGKLVGLSTGVATGPADRTNTLAIGVAEVRAFLAAKDEETPVLPKESSGPTTKVIYDDLGPPVDPVPPDFDAEARELYAKVVKSCVYILTPTAGGHAEGSGSLIDADQKLVLTTCQVVGEQSKVFIVFPEYAKGQLSIEKDKCKDRVVQKGLGVRGSVLYRDSSRDLALVKVDRIPPGTTAIPLAKSSLRVGSTVWQIGSAGVAKHVFRVTKGEVSAVGPAKFLVGGGEKNAIQVNAKIVNATTPISPNDSGGPLFDKRGYLVAVAMSPGTSDAKLVNHFVDVTEVRAFLNEKKITIKEVADEPDPPRPSAKKDNATPPKMDAERKRSDSSKPSTEDERAAAGKLRSAKLFANGEENRDTYFAKLSEIVIKWPNTEAGKEAKRLLDALK